MDHRIIANASKAQEHANFYDNFWIFDGRARHLGKFERVRAKLFREAIIKYSASNSELDILDVGCGTGWLASALHSHGSVKGVDYSRKVIEFANATFGEYGQFFVADPSSVKLGFATSDTFDVVVSSEVIEHVIDHEAFISQISLFIKPRGLFILTTPNGRLFSAIEKRYGESFQPIENWLTPNILAQLLKNNGYEIVEHKGILFRNIRYGMRGYLVLDKLGHIFKLLRMQRMYNHLLLYTSLYQFLVARR